MSTTPRNPGAAVSLRRFLSKRAALFALLGAATIAAGVAATAHEPGEFAGWHHHEAMSAEDIATHVDKFLQHVYIEVGATDVQKAQLDPLVKQAVADLMPLHTQQQNFHQQALALLTQDRIDRAAIEAMRVEHMRAADAASRRITQLIGDAAEILTPAQRKALAARVEQLHGGLAPN